MELTAQEIFDTTYDAVMAQGVPSTHQGTCKYRGENGTKCALGFLIDDETASLWDKQHSNITGILPRMIPDHLWPHLDLLYQIQMCHDDATCDYVDPFPTAFHKRMVIVADRFNLTMESDA